MKKIGQGLQFNVYENGNKVVKVPTSKFQIKLKLLFWTPPYLFKLSRLEKEATKTIKEREEIIKEIQKRKIKTSLLANLNFNNKIEQDRVIPLKKYFKDYGESKGKIDEYINFIFDCWKNGFSEKTYNLTVNNGINSKGQIVLMDFGELTFKKSDVKKAIESKRWRKSFSFKRDLKGKIREYHDKQMFKRLTLNNLNKYWKESKIKFYYNLS